MTRSLGAFTIRQKLVLITMLTCTVALVVACAVLFAYDAFVFRRQLVSAQALHADILATNSTAAIAFDDERAAKETLAALANDAHAVRALLYTRDGRVLAEYRRPDAVGPAPVPAWEKSHQFTDDRLVLWRPVNHRGESLGTLYLETDLDEIRERLYRYAGIVALVMLGSGMIALLLSSRLQRVISEPIGELIATARTISARHDYSLRVANRRHDELGVLIDGFNEMLRQVELRDRALVTAQDQLEFRVSERTAELREEIAERQQAQAELERARDVAESATRAKSAFLANMSHEIRTPMNVIIGMTDMALDSELAPEPREHLQTIRRATLGLLSIINDVLDSAKMEAGKVTIESVDVNLETLVSDVCELLESRAREKGLALGHRLDDDVPEHVLADPGRLRQVLTNLVSNAIKFTEVGGVTIEVVVLERSESEVRIRVTVRDTGIGVPPNRQGAIFESFTQADESTTRTYGGTGLGLSICQQLVGLMGGRIGVESEVGKGSTFWFEIALGLQEVPVTVGSGAATG